MPRLNRRRFQRSAKFGANGNIVFETPLSAPSLSMNGVDVQTAVTANESLINVNYLNNASRMQEIDAHAVLINGQGADIGSNTALIGSNATSIVARAGEIAVNTVKLDSHEVTKYCYIDVGRAAESYTETGSVVTPYRSLSGAMAAKLTDASTDTVIFQLAPGDYVGTISIDQPVANQGFEIRGSGCDNTRIMGSAAWDATVSNVFYLRRFTSLVVKDCCIMHGAYGNLLQGHHGFC
jgi:hypothetical protein